MGRGQITQDVRSLLYGRSRVGPGPKLVNDRLDFNQLRQQLQKNILPTWLSQTGFTIAKEAKSFHHGDLGEEMSSIYLSGPRDGQIEVALYRDNQRAHVAFHYYDDNLNGPGMSEEETLLLLLAKNIKEPITVEFTISGGRQYRQLESRYPGEALNSLRLVPPTFSDQRSEDELLTHLAGGTRTETSQQLLEQSATLLELLSHTDGAAALAEASDSATIYLAADLHQFVSTL